MAGTARWLTPDPGPPFAYSVLALAQDNAVRRQFSLDPVVVDDSIQSHYQTSGYFDPVGSVLWVETLPPARAEVVGQPASVPDSHNAHGAGGLFSHPGLE